MIYSKWIETPANTPLTSPLRTSIRLTKGLVYQFEVMFPPGAAGLHRVAVFNGGIQVYPFIPGQFFRGDGETLSFQETLLVEGSFPRFIVVSYNEDTVYDHGIEIRIGIVSEDIFIARFLPSVAAQEQERVLEEIRRRQEEEFERQRKDILTRGLDWLNDDEEEEE